MFCSIIRILANVWYVPNLKIGNLRGVNPPRLYIINRRLETPKIYKRKEMIPMKKLLNKKGFTLMEMLIVVAIIVILVAISVPTFTANLDNSKKAADGANLRAAKAAVVVYEIDNGTNSANGKYYDVDAGSIEDAAEACGQCSDHEGCKITFSNGTAQWVNSAGTVVDPCN